jgi:hypothetical protein
MDRLQQKILEVLSEGMRQQIRAPKFSYHIITNMWSWIQEIDGSIKLRKRKGVFIFFV